jgi:hypothetical protein
MEAVKRKLMFCDTPGCGNVTLKYRYCAVCRAGPKTRAKRRQAKR